MHHAIIVLGSLPPELASRLPETCVHQRYESFGVGDSRALKELQTRTLASGERRHVVIEALAVTTEAQHALLKTFEEPTPGYHFVLVVPATAELLPTLLSRCEVIVGEAPVDDELASSWISADPEKRLELVAKLLDEAAEPAAARAAALQLLQGVAAELRRHRRSIDPATYDRLLEDLVRAARFLSRRAGLPKLILEHLALILPRI